MEYRRPRQYQFDGATFLASKKRALLADEPGLGKCLQSILAADFVNAEWILIICSAAMRMVWRDEVNLNSMFGHPVQVITSPLQRPRKGVTIINYDLLSRAFLMPKNPGDPKFAPAPFLTAMCQPAWDVMILDEGHGLKEKDSQRTRAVLNGGHLAGRSRRIWWLTGTPMPNHPGELWTLLAACGETELSYQDFTQRYCKFGNGQYGKMKITGMRNDTADELKAMLRRVMMRRYKQLVLKELPPFSVDDYPVPEVTIDLAKFFADAIADKNMVQRKISEQEDFVRKIWERMIASQGKMDNMAMVRLLEECGPAVSLYRRWLGVVKATSILPTIIEELETGAVKKLVIFAHHKQVIALLKKELAHCGVVVIDGSVTSDLSRKKAIDSFQTDPEVRVFIGQNQSASEGITLTAASEIILLEPDWVPKTNAQAIMRLHRMGQTMPVRARMVRLADTLDDYISAVLARKTKEIIRIVED